MCVFSVCCSLVPRVTGWKNAGTPRDRCVTVLCVHTCAQLFFCCVCVFATSGVLRCTCVCRRPVDWLSVFAKRWDFSATECHGCFVVVSPVLVFLTIFLLTFSFFFRSSRPPPSSPLSLTTTPPPHQQPLTPPPTPLLPHDDMMLIRWCRKRRRSAPPSTRRAMPWRAGCYLGVTQW